MATLPTTVLFPDRIGRKREVDQGPEEGAGHRWVQEGRCTDMLQRKRGVR